MNWRKLNEIYTEIGEKKFAVHMANLINSEDFDTNDFSIRGLWEAMGRPNLKRDMEISLQQVDEADLFEALDSSAFPKITGYLINKTIQEAYDLEYGIGFELVTKLPSTQEDETIVGFTAQDGMLEVPQGMDYKETSFGEKYHKIKNVKWGRIIALTEEMVKFDQTAQMVVAAQRIGEKAKAKQEEIIIKAIVEYATSGDHAAWRPAGTATTLYSNTSTDPYGPAALDNLITDVLADETDIDAALALFAQFQDEAGDPIIVNPTHLFTGLGKASVAQKIFGSSGSVVSNMSSAVKNPFKGTFKPVSSAFVDQLKGATYWMLGAFKKQFVYTEVFKLQTFQAKKGNDDEFKRDIQYAWKARFMGGCGAVTNRYIVQSTGGG